MTAEPTWRALVRVAAPGRRRGGRLALGLAAGVLAGASSVALLATGAWLVARAAQLPPLTALSVAVVGVRAFAVGRAGFRYVERLVTHDATLRVLADLRVRVYARLERLAPAGLPAFRDGDLLTRTVNDVEAVQDVHLKAVLPWVAGTVVAVLTAGAAGVLLPAAGLVLLAATVLVAVLVPALTARAAARAHGGVVHDRAELVDQVVDTLERLPELTAYGALARRSAELRVTDDRLTARLASLARVRGLAAGAVTAAAGGAAAAALALGVPAVHDGRLPVVALAVLALAPLALADVLAPLPLAVAELSRSARAARRVDEVLAAPDPVPESGAPRPLPPGPHHVRLEGVTARWAEDGPEALQDVDLDLPPGRRVALVGASGSGKTTLAHVLLRFHDPAAGRVTLDGTDTRDLDGDDVRRVVGLLAQDAHVFDTTVRENVRLARPDADDAALRDALRRARLLDWVDAQPAGLDTWVGRHGERLSGGQRQRLALARVLLSDHPVVVLDEPTEHLDAATADELTADLLAATTGRTVVLVSHRLRGAEGVDEIVVLDHGRVLERGTHAQLLAAGGRYASAYADEVAARPL